MQLQNPFLPAPNGGVRPADVFGQQQGDQPAEAQPDPRPAGGRAPPPAAGPAAVLLRRPEYAGDWGASGGGQIHSLPHHQAR